MYMCVCMYVCICVYVYSYPDNTTERTPCSRVCIQLNAHIFDTFICMGRKRQTVLQYSVQKTKNPLMQTISHYINKFLFANSILRSTCFSIQKSGKYRNIFSKRYRNREHFSKIQCRDRENITVAHFQFFIMYELLVLGICIR